MPAAASASKGRAAQRTAAIILAAMLVASVAALVGEWSVYRASQDAARSLTHPLASRPRADPATLPPRAAMFEALASTRAASATTDPSARAARFAVAQTLIDHALRARPRWGMARAIETYLFFLRDGPDAPTTRAAYARSYAEAGFLPDAARWRIRYGLSQWSRLDPAMREHLLDEMSWYATVSPAAYFSTVLGAIGTPAEVAFMRRRARLAHETSGRPRSDEPENTFLH